MRCMGRGGGGGGLRGVWVSHTDAPQAAGVWPGREGCFTSPWRSWCVLVISSARRAEMSVSRMAMKATAIDE